VGQAQQVYSREFDSVLLKLEPRIRERIEAKITEVGAHLDKFPHHRLKARPEFRLRVGDYRVIYEFNLQKNIIYLMAVGHRREIYR
jgi:mRNA interferase RelE/StbE